MMSGYVQEIIQGKQHLAMRNIVEAHLEVSSDCNLNCVYCYAAKRERPKQLMRLDTAFKFIETVLINSHSRDIRLVIHGGEPLLQSTNWLRNVLNYGFRLGDQLGKTIRYEMQSNLTLLDKEKLKIISEYRVSVGTSLDGVPANNDLTRGHGAAVMKGIEELKTVGCFGGLICVTGTENCTQIYDLLKYLNSVKIFACNLLIRYCVGNGSLLPPLNSAEIFTAFMGSFDYLVDTRGKAIIEKNVAGKLSRFLKPPSAKDFQEILVCNHPICGAGLTTCLCDAEGMLYPCGCSVHDPANAAGRFDGDFDEEYIQIVKRFHARHASMKTECAKCSALIICRCGCAAFGPYDSKTSYAECKAVKDFYSMLHRQPKSLIQEIVGNIEAQRCQ